MDGPNELAAAAVSIRLQLEWPRSAHFIFPTSAICATSSIERGEGKGGDGQSFARTYLDPLPRGAWKTWEVPEETRGYLLRHFAAMAETTDVSIVNVIAGTGSVEGRQTLSVIFIVKPFSHGPGARNLWCQRFCMIFLEICTPSLF